MAYVTVMSFYSSTVSGAITNGENCTVQCLAKKRPTLNLGTKGTHCDQCLPSFYYILQAKLYITSRGNIDSIVFTAT